MDIRQRNNRIQNICSECAHGMGSVVMMVVEMFLIPAKAPEKLRLPFFIPRYPIEIGRKMANRSLAGLIGADVNSRKSNAQRVG